VPLPLVFPSWLPLARVLPSGENTTDVTHPAIVFYQRAVEADWPYGTWEQEQALKRTAELMKEAGRVDEAIRWLTGLAETGDRGIEVEAPIVLVTATAVLEKIGRAAEAHRLRRYGLEPGGRIADPW
jgi:hypothetical protein